MMTIQTNSIDWYDRMRLTGLLLALVTVFCWAVPAHAQITVTASGPGGTRSQTVPGSGGLFDLNLPLNRNAVNTVTVTATDSSGQKASHELKVTQLSLDQIVVSQVTAERMSVEQVKQLVSDGVIQLDNPANFNVSTFAIVLTIGTKPVAISVAVATAIAEETTGWEQYKVPEGSGSSSGNPPPAPTEIIVFEEPIPAAPGRPRISIPGVIIIEGNIKSLKEFYTVRLLLMNTSGIFTLKDIVSDVSFPDGGLTSIAPANGVISFGDILPGDGGLPGQAERQFIIRGDAIGIRQVKVGFGGTVAGPGIPEASPVPFNGSALTKVEVKGPPTFLVKATHPDAVITGVPYEFKVEITNTGDIAALYTSLDLSVGADGVLVSCDTATPPVCTELERGGTETRTFGDILPGRTVSAVFMIKPLKTGLISSCLGVSDQNITLQVLVGTIGCLVGQLPPERGVPDGTPTVSVVPTANTLGVSIDSAVAAFFTQEMAHATITTGSGGTFNVYDRANNIVPGILSLITVNGKTVATWQVHDNITTRLAPNIEYTVVLTTGIANSTGVQLYNAWTSRFTTTGEALNDTTPPTLAITVVPPVNPSYVLPGQLVKVDAYAADQGSGVVRVELRIKDLTLTEGSYLLVDRKVVFTGDLPPYIFTIDSAQLVAGHTYQLMATAYDYMMNAQNATINLVIAASAAAPTITLPAPPSLGIPQGISVSITPESVTGGVNEVRYYLDGATSPFSTVYIPPYQAGTGTLTLALGNHTIRAVAVDALAQTGQAIYTFNLVANPNKPQISLNGTVDGATYIVGSSFVVSGTATDPLGIASVRYTLDGALAPIAAGTQPFTISTALLTVGSHAITAEAVNTIGATNTLISTFVVVALPNGSAPAAPVISSLSVPANGNVTLSGTTVGGARLDITNATQQFGISVNANGSGSFSAAIAAAVGDLIQVVAYDYTTSQQPSPAATATVLAPPVLNSISATPETMSLTAANAWQDITVTGSYDNGSSASLTSQATYSSSNPTVASANAGGRVVALKSGVAVITASCGGKTAQVALTVDIVVVTSITVDPATVELAAIGQSLQLVVTAHYSNSTAQTIASGVSFVSGNNSVATVSVSGLVTPVGNGATSVTAYLPGAPPVSVPVTVNTANDPVPQVLILSPASGSTVQRGDIVSVSVRASDSVGGVSRVLLRSSGPVAQIISTETRPISPTSQDVTTSFSFSVPDTLAIGSSIVVTAGAEDTGGQSAVPVAISLSVVDTTAPAVTIAAPASQTRYNYGDTVSVTVAASDRVGVTSVRYATTGGVILSGSQQMAQASPTATHTFGFTIPFGFSNPDVRILAWATDVSGNEGAAVPVDIVVTSADIVAPETHVTAVAAPGASTTTIVTYQVDSGLADLDHVEIYFRRNGIGTYNRYTDPVNNSEGKFVPQAGGSGTGTVAFDSTKMGGDGAYEFYSIGVDKAGNREAAPVSAPSQVLPDETAAFAAGTVWTVITSPATAGEVDTIYDNRNIRVSGTTFTVNGAHSFNNVELLGGAVLTHAAATLTGEARLDLTVWSLAVDSTSSINVDARGYLGGGRGGNDCTGQTLGNVDGSASRSGGSYGGVGGVYDGGPPNPVYGSMTNPTGLGSGGSCGPYGRVGGNGGGWVAIHAGNISLDGILSANGGVGSADYQPGSGSGGTINLVIATLSGSGTISANGGGNQVGGGGGRIAVNYIDMSTLHTSHIQSLGGQGADSNGANGTVFLKNVGGGNGTLVIDGQGASSSYTALPSSAYVFDSIVLRNNARVVADAPIVVTGTLSVTGGSTLTHSIGSEAGLRIQAARVEVDETSSLDVSARGYRGGGRDGNTGCNGITLGGLPGAAYRSGGSYGGYGGVVEGTGSNAPYGQPSEAIYLGSGGSCGPHGRVGGNGGGLITIMASEAVVVNGSVRADGGAGSADYLPGGGSGGSISIRTSLLQGAGIIAANGGGVEVGGGGGRIAISYNDLGDSGQDFAGLRNISAFGGHGSSTWGSAGTVLLKRGDQPYGDLYVDDNMSTSTSSAWTPLTLLGFGKIVAMTANTLTTNGAVKMAVNGLVGMEIHPNLTQTQTYRAISNTETTITVDTAGKPDLTTGVANIGDTYAGVYRFDNVYFRRGGFLVMGDQLIVGGTLKIDEYGQLTHYGATLNVEPMLDLTVGTLEITGVGAINVDARGYLGGGRGGNDCTGQTLGNVNGSAYRSGGSYGGLGGVYDGGPPNPVYGSMTNPAGLGSGGSCGPYGYVGGDGGGWIAISAGSISLEGAISANGGAGNGYQAGSGSGGTINLVTTTLFGAGTIRANGGGNEVGGGGGRIAVSYFEPSPLNVNMQSLGGQGTGSVGAPGTVSTTKR